MTQGYGWYSKLFKREFLYLDELQEEISYLPNQTTGIQTNVSEIGEPYKEIRAHAIARLGDEKLVERYVAESICQQLEDYFQGREGRIYWRETFKYDVLPFEIVLRLDVNGPDTDFVTGQKCVKDKNWILVTAYCRVARAVMAIPQEVHLEATIGIPGKGRNVQA